MFQIEYLIYFYMFVSIAMGLFDFLFLFYERFRDYRFRKKTKRMAKYLAHEIETNAEFPTQAHKDELVKQMRKLSGMESFDLTMIRFSDQEPDKCAKYLNGIASVFERLSRYFAGKDELHKAYFAYIVKFWYRKRPASDAIIGSLLTYTRSDSLYQRENALEALSQVGTAAQLVEGMLTVENNAAFHHPKLVTEAAMAFAGDPVELAKEFSRRLVEFPPNMQAAAINFLRMKGGGDRDELVGLLEDPEADPEVRIACIRYFMRRLYRGVVPTLRKIALSDDPGLWELSSVAATALGSYIDRPTIATLIRCLSSPVWYVRFNAAKSLYDSGLSLQGRYLGPVMAHGDRYARDMLTYRWALEAESKRRPNSSEHATPKLQREEEIVEYEETTALQGEHRAEALNAAPMHTEEVA